MECIYLMTLNLVLCPGFVRYILREADGEEELIDEPLILRPHSINFYLWAKGNHNNAAGLQALERTLGREAENIIAIETTIKENDSRSLISSSTKTIAAKSIPPAAAVPKVFNSSTQLIMGCSISQFTFPEKDHLDYVQYRGTLPRMTSLTACMWLRSPDHEHPVKGTFMSYCAEGSKGCNAATVSLYSASLVVNSEMGSSTFESDLPVITHSTHFCLVLNSHSAMFYVNGTQKGDRQYTKEGSGQINGGGVLIFGQDQDLKINGSNPGPPNTKNRYQGFFGEMQGFHVWNRALSLKEIEGLFAAGECHCVRDSIMTFHDSNSIVKVDVIEHEIYRCH